MRHTAGHVQHVVAKRIMNQKIWNDLIINLTKASNELILRHENYMSLLEVRTR